MNSASQRSDDSESTSNASSFETQYANQPTEFPILDTSEIDKRLRSSGAGALVCTKKYGETFLYVAPPPTADLFIIKKSMFMG